MSSPTPSPVRLRSLLGALRQALQGCQRVLEIGCGVDSPMQYLAGEYHLEGLDIHEPSLEACKKKGFLKEAHLGSAMEIEKQFGPDAFDAVVALDLIEHLKKEDGQELMRQMEAVAAKAVIIFTPNGFVPQHCEDNPWQEHLSGWTTAEFRQRGYQVSGINGWKALRGEFARVKYPPRLLWAAVSEVTQILWTGTHPESAFSLFAHRRL